MELPVERRARFEQDARSDLEGLSDAEIAVLRERLRRRTERWARTRSQGLLPTLRREQERVIQEVLDSPPRADAGAGPREALVKALVLIRELEDSTRLIRNAERSLGGRNSPLAYAPLTPELRAQALGDPRAGDLWVLPNEAWRVLGNTPDGSRVRVRAEGSGAVETLVPEEFQRWFAQASGEGPRLRRLSRDDALRQVRSLQEVLASTDRTANGDLGVSARAEFLGWLQRNGLVLEPSEASPDVLVHRIVGAREPIAPYGVFRRIARGLPQIGNPDSLVVDFGLANRRSGSYARVVGSLDLSLEVALPLQDFLRLDRGPSPEAIHELHHFRRARRHRHTIAELQNGRLSAEEAGRRMELLIVNRRAQGDYARFRSVDEVDARTPEINHRLREIEDISGEARSRTELFAESLLLRQRSKQVRSVHRLQLELAALDMIRLETALRSFEGLVPGEWPADLQLSESTLAWVRPPHEVQLSLPPGSKLSRDQMVRLMRSAMEQQRDRIEQVLIQERAVAIRIDETIERAEARLRQAAETVRAREALGSRAFSPTRMDD